MSDKAAIWLPNPGPQTLFCSCPYRDVLFGGALGGGKTAGLVGDAYHGVPLYGKNWRAVIFRRTYKQLEEVMRFCMKTFAPVYGHRAYKKSEKTWYFDGDHGSGTARLDLRHMQYAQDVHDHQGQEYQWVGFDEAGHFETEEYVNYLNTRLRSPAGVSCYMRLTANPGGVGHHWLKKRYMLDFEGKPVAPLTPMEVVEELEDGDVIKYHRMFIPSRLQDNPYLMQDKMYLAQLQQIADPVMKRALLEGDWTVVAGQMFTEFSRKVHVIPSGPFPSGKIWMALDPGSSRPYAGLWFVQTYDGEIIIPAEIYGKGGKPNQGSGESPSEVWQRIMGLEQNFGIWVRERWIDGQEDGDNPTGWGMMCGGAKARWQGWAKGPGSVAARARITREWLKVVNGRSRLHIMDRCENLIRTLETLPRDLKKPEEHDSDAEDHAYDAMSGGLIRDKLTTMDRRATDAFQAAVSEYNRALEGQVPRWQ